MEQSLSQVPASKLVLGLITDPVLTESELAERLSFCAAHNVSTAFWKIPLPASYYAAFQQVDQKWR